MPFYLQNPYHDLAQFTEAMKKYIILTVSILAFEACKKAEKHPYSHWSVNGIAYSSNNISASHSRVETNIRCNGLAGFGFNFPYASIPIGETFILKGGISNGVSTAGGAIYIRDSIYAASPFSNTSIIIISVDGKARWTVGDTWFINTQNSSDSVLANGDFGEP